MSLAALMLVLAACNASPPPAPLPPVLAVPVASSIPAAAASSVTPAPSCTPHAWLAVDAPRGAIPFGASAPDPAALLAASPALRAACKRTEIEAKQHRSAAFPATSGMFGADMKRAVRDSTTMGCFAGAKGAWVLEVGVFHPGQSGSNAKWQLVYLTPDALRITGPGARGEDWEADGEGRSSTGIAGVHDFDGDGVDEAAIESSGYASIDGFLDTGPVLYRVQDDSVVVWNPVPGRKVIGAADVDHDGLFDLVLAGRGERPELAHAVAGGTYTLDDEVTRAFLHAACLLPPPPPSPIVAQAMPLMPGAAPSAAPTPIAPTPQCAGVLAIDCPR
jgi:hypothetical protein